MLDEGVYASPATERAVPDEAIVSRAVSTPALNELPPRRPLGSAPADSPVQWTLIDLGRYVVTRGRRTLGFIDVVGAVYVALVGTHYNNAVEARQTLVFDQALTALEAQQTN